MDTVIGKKVRELSPEEVEEVTGGFLVIGAAIGGASAGGSALLQGSSPKGVAIATAFGAISGACGGLAGAATTGSVFVRALWGVRAVVYGMLTGPASDA